MSGLTYAALLLILINRNLNTKVVQTLFICIENRLCRAEQDEGRCNVGQAAQRARGRLLLQQAAPVRHDQAAERHRARRKNDIPHVRCA